MPRSRSRVNPRHGNPRASQPMQVPTASALGLLFVDQLIEGQADAGGLQDVFVASARPSASARAIHPSASACGLVRHRQLPASRRSVPGRRPPDRLPVAILISSGEQAGWRAPQRQEYEHATLTQQRDHPQQSGGTFQFVVVAAGEHRDRFPFLPPTKRIHPVVSAGWGGEDGQRPTTFQDRWGDSEQPANAQVDRQHGRVVARLLHQRSGLFRCRCTADHELDVAQLLLNFLEPPLDGGDFFFADAPAPIGRHGLAGKDRTDAGLRRMCFGSLPRRASIPACLTGGQYQAAHGRGA